MPSIPPRRQFLNLLLLFLVADPAQSQAQPEQPSQTQSWAGKPLSALLEALRHGGVQVLYSSALVPDGLLVTGEPQGATLLERTAAAARASGLELRLLAPGHYVVNRATPASGGAAPATADGADALIAHPPALDEITIFASRYAFGDGVENSIHALSADLIAVVPGAASDVVKAARTLPGAASADDVRPHIRGSQQDDALTLFDHIPIADPYHLQSFQRLMSAFDASVVGGMTVYSGGFPARFGTRSGGVIDIVPRTAEGGDEYSVSAGTLTQRLSALGRKDDLPLEWLGAVRRSAPQYAVESFGNSFDRPTILDGVARLRWQPTAAVSWTGGFLFLDDRLDFNAEMTEEDVRARSRDWYAWLTRESLPVDGWQSRGSLSVSHSERTRDGVVARPYFATGSLTEHRDFQGVEAATEWVRDSAPGVRWNLGAQLGRMSGEDDYRRAVVYSPAAAAIFALNAAEPLTSASAPSETYYAVHASLRVRSFERLEAEVGLRFDGQEYSAAQEPLPGHGMTQVSPRLNLRYRIAPQVNLYASWGRFSQDQRPNEWRLEENQQRPDPVQTSAQTIIGLSRDFSPLAAVRLEWYRNHWTHVHPYFDNLLSTQSLLPDLTPDRVRIAPAAADADGLELSARGRLGPSGHYWASYTLSRVTDRIGGVDVPRSWDQRSALNAGLAWQSGPCVVSGSLLYHSGWSRTPLAVAAQAAPQEPGLLLGARNAGRWSDYVSADLRVSWKKPLRAAQVEWFAEVTNLSNRGNPSSAALALDSSGMGATPTLGHWLPRQFNAGVTWTMR